MKLIKNRLFLHKVPNHSFIVQAFELFDDIQACVLVSFVLKEKKIDQFLKNCYSPFSLLTLTCEM